MRQCPTGMWTFDFLPALKSIGSVPNILFWNHSSQGGWGRVSRNSWPVISRDKGCQGRAESSAHVLDTMEIRRSPKRNKSLTRTRMSPPVSTLFLEISPVWAELTAPQSSVVPPALVRLDQWEASAGNQLGNESEVRVLMPTHSSLESSWTDSRWLSLRDSPSGISNWPLSHTSPP